MVALGVIRTEFRAEEAFECQPGFAGRGRSRDQQCVGQLISVLAGGLFLVAGELRRQIRHHLLELYALLRIQDLHNSRLAGGAEIVQLLLQAL